MDNTQTSIVPTQPGIAAADITIVRNGDKIIFWFTAILLSFIGIFGVVDAAFAHKSEMSGAIKVALGMAGLLAVITYYYVLRPIAYRISGDRLTALYLLRRSKTVSLAGLKLAVLDLVVYGGRGRSMSSVKGLALRDGTGGGVFFALSSFSRADKRKVYEPVKLALEAAKVPMGQNEIAWWNKCFKHVPNRAEHFTLLPPGQFAPGVKVVTGSTYSWRDYTHKS